MTRNNIRGKERCKMKYLFGTRSCWRSGVLCLLITGMAAVWTFAGPRREIPRPEVPSDSKRQRLSTEDIEVAIEAIEKIQAIASKSKKFDVAIAQLESIAKVATVSRIRVAAVFAISNLYVEQGRHAEAMSALARLAGGSTRSSRRTGNESQSDQARIQWTRLPDMLAPHYSSGAAALEGKLYVWSGHSAKRGRHFNHTTAMEVYDPASGKWTTAASIPSGRTGLGSFALGGKIYSIGGEQSPCGSFSNTVHRYDPDRDEWKQLKRFPAKAWDPMSVVCGDKAYVMGGRRGYGPTYPCVYVYDVEKDSWSKKADMPRSVLCGGGASLGGKIYVFGGTHKLRESHDEMLSIVQIYDPVKNSWTTRKMPCTLYMVKAVASGGSIWVFAGNMRDESSGKLVPCPWVFRYSPTDDKWTEYRLDIPAGQSFSSPVAVINGLAYLTDFHDKGKRQKIAYAVNLRALKLRSSSATGAKKPGGWRYPNYDRFQTGVNPVQNRRRVSLENGLKLVRTLKGSTLLTGDLDRDGKTEWVLTDGGELRVLNNQGQKVWTHTFEKPAGSLFIEDVDKCPGLEIVGSCGDGKGKSLIFVLSSKGKLLKSIPFAVNGEGIGPQQVCDLDGDGKKEIIATVGSGYGRHRRGIRVFDYESGKEMWHFEIGPQPGALIVDDVNGDGKKEIMLGMGSPHNGNSANGYSDLAGSWIICFTHKGKILWDAKLGTWGLVPIYADVDGDGRKELVVYRNQDYYGGNATVYLLNPKTGAILNRYDGKAGDSCWQGVVGDMDGDGKMAIFSTFGVREKCLYALNSKMKATAKLSKVEVAKAAGDLCGDERLELVTLDYGGSGFHVRDKDLKSIWSGRVPAGKVGNAMICDLNGDGINELVIQANRNFYVYNVSPDPR
jgi:N-acetylneuraminic acid mutarotase